MTEKIFKEIDLLLVVRMSRINSSLETIREFLDENDIPLATPVGGESDKKIGDVLIETLGALNQFLYEYKGIKETWRLTNA